MPALVMEPICVEGRISGSAIISDLLDRIRERLVHNNDLRAVDSYASYSAHIVLDLTLLDVDPVKVVAEIAVGQPRPQPITLTVPPVVASAVEERLGVMSVDTLERAVDGSRPEPRTFIQPNLEKPVVEPAEPPQGAMVQDAPAGKRYSTPKR